MEMLVLTHNLHQFFLLAVGWSGGGPPAETVETVVLEVGWSMAAGAGGAGNTPFRSPFTRK
jgi:hypothetical protein